MTDTINMDAAVPRFAIVSTTVTTREAALDLARMLVDRRLAACVQIVPVDSVYRWSGAVEQAREAMLLCKILAADFSTVEAAITTNHDYEIPEIVMTPIIDGSHSYLAWLAESLRR